MRVLASICTVTLLAATTPRAFAGKCYVDSDCPTGMVCNYDGGCVVPNDGNSSSNGNGNGGGSHRSSGVMLLYGVVLVAVIVAILVPAMQATEDAQNRSRFDGLPPIGPNDRTPPVTGFTFAF